jgi:hypothetical protein
MTKKPLYMVLARTIAWQPPVESEYVTRKDERLNELLDMLPSGGGWDLGTSLAEGSGPEKIMLYGEWHHINDGMYDGWTEHTIVVTPSLQYGFKLRITGVNRNDIKDVIADEFHEVLSMPVWEYDYALEGGFVVEDREGEPLSVAFDKTAMVWKVWRWEGGRHEWIVKHDGGGNTEVK